MKIPAIMMMCMVGVRDGARYGDSCDVHDAHIMIEIASVQVYFPRLSCLRTLAFSYGGDSKVIELWNIIVTKGIFLF